MAPTRTEEAPLPGGGEPPTRTAGDRAVAIELGALAAVSVVVCTAAHRPALLLAAVVAAGAARTVSWSRLGRAETGHGPRTELVLLLVGTALGAANDWASVHVFGVYRYTVPTLLDGIGVPVWMLLFWGLVLRALVTVSRWRRLRPTAPSDLVHLGPWRVDSPAAKLSAELALLATTRLALYRWHDHATGSWLPFALAIGVWAALFRPGRHDWTVVGSCLLLGPTTEALYIGLGDLHRYEHGLVAGIPAWIVLWWALAALAWKDVSARLVAALERSPAPAPASVTGARGGPPSTAE